MTHGAMYNVNSAATLLGYIVLALVLLLVVFFATKLVRELIHDGRRKRFERREWEYTESTWFHDELSARRQDRHETDIIDFPQTVEMHAVDNQREQKKRGHRKVR